jgi:hypothetical protein
MPQFPCQNINLFYRVIYGGFGWGRSGCDAYLGLASGLPQTGNPPYYPDNVLALFPKFFGIPSLVTGTADGTTGVIINVDSTAGALAGQFVTAPNTAPGTVITAVGTNAITISNAPSVAGAITLSIYEAPPVVLAVLQLYLNIAYASLMQSRWREQWQLAMALYIAHYLTLWEQTEGNPQTTASQIVANSLQAGITISQGADGVNQGLAILETLASWGTWTLTQYGVQLATLAKLVGSGPIYVRAGGCGPQGGGGWL